MEVRDAADHRGSGDEVLAVLQEVLHQVDIAHISLDELVLRDARRTSG